MSSIDPTNTHMRYLFAQHPSLPTAEAIQRLLKTSEPPSIVTGRTSDGSTVRFALLPHTAIEPITKAIYPDPPTFKPAQLAAKNLSNDSPAPCLGDMATLPQYRSNARNHGNWICRQPGCSYHNFIKNNIRFVARYTACLRCGSSRWAALNVDRGHALAPGDNRATWPTQDEYPVLYFLYGSLADPAKLKALLGLGVEPLLAMGKIGNGKLMMCGGYRALVDAGEECKVRGSVYIVQNESQEELLRYYETAMYEVVRCEIELGGESMWGLTFRFCGRRDELKELDAQE